MIMRDEPEGNAVHDTEFVLTYDRFDSAAEGLREALTSTGNGYFCTRGTAEWEDMGTVHYPGTYARGGYNLDHDHGWSPRAQRRPGESAHLAGAEAADRGGGRDPAR